MNFVLNIYNSSIHTLGIAFMYDRLGDGDSTKSRRGNNPPAATREKGCMLRDLQGNVVFDSIVQKHDNYGFVR